MYEWPVLIINFCNQRVSKVNCHLVVKNVSRTVVPQLNPWGAQAGDGGGLDPQRTDLWSIDFSQVVAGLSRQTGVTAPPIPPFFACGLSFPEPKVKPDIFRRDSRPYQMPAFDDPPDPVRISFIVESPALGGSSTIYRLLSLWRTVVRAGRGAMSNEISIPLNSDYRIDYAFNINVFLLKGTKPSVSSSTPDDRGSTRIDVSNDLDYSGTYTLINAWLSSFKLCDVSYRETQVMTIDAQFYVEDIVDQNASNSFE